MNSFNKNIFLHFVPPNVFYRKRLISHDAPQKKKKAVIEMDDTKQTSNESSDKSSDIVDLDLIRKPMYVFISVSDNIDLNRQYTYIFFRFWKCFIDNME